MRRLTNIEITESDVVLRIHPDRLALDVSAEVEQLLRLYGRCEFDGKDLVFSIPAYRYREEIEPVIWREAYDWMAAKMSVTVEFITQSLAEGQSPARLMEFFAARPNMNSGLLSQIEAAINHIVRHIIRERNLLETGREERL